MTGLSGPEVLVRLQPINPTSLWLAFELRCDSEEIEIRAALLTRTGCTSDDDDQTHNVYDGRPLTVGSVVARLCKWKGNLDLPPGFDCLLNRAGTLREALVDQCELYGSGVDVFVVERMEIEPDYRGRELGLTAMRALLRTFATGETLAAIRPSPFVPEGQTLSPTELREGQERLRRYWQRAGFQRFGRTDILVRAPGQQR